MAPEEVIALLLGIGGIAVAFALVAYTVVWPFVTERDKLRRKVAEMDEYAFRNKATIETLMRQRDSHAEKVESLESAVRSNAETAKDLLAENTEFQRRIDDAKKALDGIREVLEGNRSPFGLNGGFTVKDGR